MKSVKVERVEQGLIWQNENEKWCKRCPTCSNTQPYSSYDSCLEKLRLKTECNHCAKSGPRNPGYKKSPSIVTRKKISLAGTGKHYGPCPIDRRRKISETKRRNNLGLLSQNGSNQFKRKEYRFPDGRTEWVQGYEPWTLDKLLSENIPSTDLIIKGTERPIITYAWSGSTARYLPDCRLKNTNVLVETKSKWTWNLKLQQNLAKITGSLQSGFNVRLIIWEDGKKLFSDQTYIPEKSI